MARIAVNDSYSLGQVTTYMASLKGKNVWIKSIFTDNEAAKPFLRDPSARPYYE